VRLTSDISAKPKIVKCPVDLKFMTSLSQLESTGTIYVTIPMSVCCIFFI